MRLAALAVLFFSVASGCATSGPCGGRAVSTVDDCFKPGALGEARDRVEPLRLRYPDGAVSAEGRGIADGSAFDPKSWEAPIRRDTVPIRSGLWRYYYPDGQEQAVIRTRLAVEVWCGVVAFFEPYDVKEGAFQFYHPNGALLAEGTFEPTTVHRENTCEGGVEIEAGAVPSTTVFYDSTGAALTDPERVVEVRELIERW